MKRTIVVLVVVFALGIVVGTRLRPRSVAASNGRIESWGVVNYNNPSGGGPIMVLAVAPPVRIGNLTQVGQPIDTGKR